MLRSVKIYLCAVFFFLILGFAGHATAGCVGSTTDFHCGQTITESCTMDEDLTTASYSCFTIGANDIVVDGNGHSITGPYVLPSGPSGGKGIGATTYDNVTIKNFTLSGFYWGIMLSSGTSSCTVQGNTVSGAYFGIELSSSTGDTVQSNTVTGSMAGIKLNNSTRNTVSQNRVSGGSYAFLLYPGAHDNVLDKNQSTSNSFDGIRMLEAERNILSNNVVTGSGWDGIYLWKGPGTVIRNNEIGSNTYNGISIEDCAGSTVKYNKISNNSGSGIQLFSDAPDNVLLGNKLCGNGNGATTFDVKDGANNRGSSNTCATNSGYNDDNAGSGCAFACGCGCVSATTTYDCGDTITESCALTCDLVSSGAYCLGVAASNIIVDGHGFTIHGNGTGSAIKAVGTTRATIRNFGIDNFGSGIGLVKQVIPQVRNSTQNRILSNRVENTSQQAIYLSDSTGNSIGNNILNDNNKGINLQATSTGNNISNNIVARSAVDGIYFAANADNNTLADNTFCASGNRDVNNAGTNTGTGTTCTKTGGTYHDTGKTGCTHTCGICSDGTFFGECSNDKPKYCMEGTLIDDCVRCGCDTDNCNASTGACEAVPPPAGSVSAPQRSSPAAIP
ncbi:MAG: NosD domain-containing protein [Syntrophobacteraceae bacterium]